MIEHSQTTPYQHIYLSPHYDDVSLSCGGRIHQLTQAGQAVLVVTICAAKPPAERFSAFAATMHQRWGSPADVIATRRSEDQASMEILGVDYRYLSVTDCIYRGEAAAGIWYYNSDADIFGEIHPDDLELADKIAADLSNLIPSERETTLYAPLTVGHHVDHQLTFAAARRLQDRGYPVVYYEDYPYTDPNYPYYREDEENLYPLEETLAGLSPLTFRPEFYFLTEEDLQTKIDSIRAYASQLDLLFGGETAMARYVRDYALTVGGSQPAERGWLCESR